jgi:DNA-binding NarL/FixJ family response regulator
MSCTPESDHSTDMHDSNIQMKVFLVDDSAMIRDRVAGMLSEHAMNIVGQAETPQDSIDGILAARPDVVVLDIQLRGGTSLEVLRVVRQVQPDIAFVVFSNSSAPAYRKRYLGAGAQRFLDKTVDFNQLASAVQEAGRSVH